MGPLYHYTCDHAHPHIHDQRQLVPARDLIEAPPRLKLQVPWQANVVWLTDLAQPDRLGLGLTSQLISCDRTVHRYRVTSCPPEVRAWTVVRQLAPPAAVDELEAAPGADPSHWFVSPVPVPVVYDPLPVALTR